MKLKALKEFNHGSIDQHYLPGDVFTISDGDGAELVAAGLAEPTSAKADHAAEGRETKPDAAAKVITHKSVSAPAPDSKKTK